MKHRIAKLALVFVSLSFTAFVFLNTYEVVFNRDIVFADSIRRFGAQLQIRTIVHQFDIQSETNRGGLRSPAYQKLDYLRIPALGATLQLEEQRVVDGQWYVRPSLGHYIGLNKDGYGTTVDYLIYAVKSWQTLPDPNQIETGMEAELVHDGRPSTFIVAEKKVLPTSATFVASKSDDRQIILLIDDGHQKEYYAFSLVLGEG